MQKFHLSLLSSLKKTKFNQSLDYLPTFQIRHQSIGFAIVRFAVRNNRIEGLVIQLVLYPEYFIKGTTI